MADQRRAEEQDDYRHAGDYDEDYEAGEGTAGFTGGPGSRRVGSDSAEQDYPTYERSDADYHSRGLSGGDYESGYGGMRAGHGRRGNESGDSATEHGHGQQGESDSDQHLRDAVQEHLTGHQHMDARYIEVTVNQGEVTLDGTVSTTQEKDLAGSIVETVAGVLRLHNNLRISAPGAWQGNDDQEGQISTRARRSSNP
jgi:hypothetical protein